MNDKILSFLGICRRAGKMKMGADVVIESVQAGKAKLVLYANDFSRSSLKPVLTAAHRCNIMAIELNRTKDELGFAIGKLCGVLAIEDEGFAEKLKQLTTSEQGGELYDKI